MNELSCKIKSVHLEIIPGIYSVMLLKFACWLLFSGPFVPSGVPTPSYSYIVSYIVSDISGVCWFFYSVDWICYYAYRSGSIYLISSCFDSSLTISSSKLI